ncbi:replication factor a 3 protein [Rutstroemia sp. NJR-2017a WRK4]|nr:replication factor a 3 protein [Rutstroemia sp. NJR-2017a WRK4]
MAETPTTPRITTSYLDQFPNRTVRMVGKVTLLRGEEAKIDCDGEVRILLGRDAHLQVGNAVEIVGKVNQDLSIKVLRATDFGNNFDFKSMNALVDVTHLHKQIWYGDN